jgi:hypothetical protein
MKLGRVKLVILFVAMTLVSVNSQPGSAQDSSAGATIQCEAPGGYFSQYDLPVEGSRFRVSGRIKLLTTDYSSKNWSPGARFAIAEMTDGIEKTRWVGIEMLVPPEQFKDELPIGIGLSQKELETPRATYPLLRLNDDNVAFALTYDRGNMTVKVNETERSFTFNVPDPVAWILCSSGSFEFSDIQIDALP